MSTADRRKSEGGMAESQCDEIRAAIKKKRRRKDGRVEQKQRWKGNAMEGQSTT